MKKTMPDGAAWLVLARAAVAIKRGEPLGPDVQAAVNRAFVLAWEGSSLDPLAGLQKRGRGRPAVRKSKQSPIVTAFQALVDAGRTPHAASRLIGASFNVAPKTALRHLERGRQVPASNFSLPGSWVALLQSMGVTAKDVRRAAEWARTIPDDGYRFKAASAELDNK